MSPFERLHRGDALSDAEFDVIYSPRLQKLSELFWTPVQVAKRAAEFLAPTPGTRVLDVGSGAGKFCLVGTCVTQGRFFGIEQRLDLVEESRDLAKQQPSHIEFRHGDMQEIDWSEFDSFFLYNPFHELTAGPWGRIDKSVGHSPQTQQRYVDTVLKKLEDATAGTRVATYFGFGGSLPESYELVASEQFGNGPLQLWAKRPLKTSGRS